MSTSLSPTFQQSKFVSGLPLDLIMNVGMMKQQKFDQNVALAQQKIDILGANSIVRPQDKEKFNSQINNIVSEINNLASQDLSDISVFGKINNTISTFANNPEFTSLIADNKRASEAYTKAQEAMNDPKRSGASNTRAFLDNWNKWYSGETSQWDPNNNYFDYQDTKKPTEDAAKYIASNPNIRQEIEYYDVVDPITGKTERVKRGEREIKEAEALRIAELAKANMDPDH